MTREGTAGGLRAGAANGRPAGAGGGLPAGAGGGLSARVVTGLRSFELDAELDVARGTVAIAGPSGAGKTTLLRVIAGLRTPREGRVDCDGRCWFDSARGVDVPAASRQVGVVFQHHALFPHLDVARNVAFGTAAPGIAARFATAARRSRRERVDELLRRFGIEHLRDAKPHSLSGGERQRVALARALAPDPALLLLDEPLSALDPETRSAAAAELAASLASLSVPALVVTHDFVEAATLADRIAVVDHGRIVQTGTATELAARPASAFVARFAGANVLRGRARPKGPDITEVALERGTTIRSAERGSGPVSVAVDPWEVVLSPPGEPTADSALNHLPGVVDTIAPLGSRVRVTLRLPEHLVVELTQSSAERLALAPGSRVRASFKATATRLIAG